MWEIIYAILTDCMQQWHIIQPAVISDQVGGNVGHTALLFRQKKCNKTFEQYLRTSACLINQSPHIIIKYRKRLLF